MNIFLHTDSLIPLIRKQMLATYYKFTEGEIDDKTVIIGNIQEIDKKLVRQKKNDKCLVRPFIRCKNTKLFYVKVIFVLGHFLTPLL